MTTNSSNTSLPSLVKHVVETRTKQRFSPSTEAMGILKDYLACDVEINERLIQSKADRDSALELIDAIKADAPSTGKADLVYYFSDNQEYEQARAVAIQAHDSIWLLELLAAAIQGNREFVQQRVAEFPET